MKSSLERSGTEINIGGAFLTIDQSERDPGYARIKTSGTDVRINHEMPWMLYNGARMAPLDIVTLKVDRGAGTWAMWFRDALVATDMPPGSEQGDLGKVQITAGKAGAWLCGLVYSDENPLFENANDNTVPDDFERQLLGELLDAGGFGQIQHALRAAWLDEKLSRPPSVFILTTPLPDSFPEGQFVHGMIGGLKFGTSKKN
ncbi:MAG: hypothetical protein ACOZE5_05075 [Verrucomicrobiota bacterium]